MTSKLVFLLVVVGAGMAFPSEEQSRPSQLSVYAPGPVAPPRPVEPQGPGQELAESHTEGKEDLKTDNTFWWGRSYYPVYHHAPRYHVYYPRTYYYSPYWW